MLYILENNKTLIIALKTNFFFLLKKVLKFKLFIKNQKNRRHKIINSKNINF